MRFYCGKCNEYFKYEETIRLRIKRPSKIMCPICFGDLIIKEK